MTVRSMLMPYRKQSNTGAEADIVLLGPQVRFNLAKVKEQCPNCPVEAIDMAAYGAMDGAKVIRRVKEVLGD